MCDTINKGRKHSIFCNLFLNIAHCSSEILYFIKYLIGSYSIETNELVAEI